MYRDSIQQHADEYWFIGDLLMPGPSVQEIWRGRRYALILGHEVNGVDQQIVNQCDVCLEIPQRGTKHSLNVSVSGGIAIWHFFASLCAGR